MSILTVEHLSHGFGDRAIFQDVSFRMLKGEHIGLVGAQRRRKIHLLQYYYRSADARYRQNRMGQKYPHRISGSAHRLRERKDHPGRVEIRLLLPL